MVQEHVGKRDPEERSKAQPSTGRTIGAIASGDADTESCWRSIGFGHAECEAFSKTYREWHEVRSWAECVGCGRQAPAGDVNLKSLAYRRHLKP